MRQRAAAVILEAGMTNTWDLQANTLYTVQASTTASVGSCHIRNIGTGALWLRLDGQDASIGDEQSELIPGGGTELDVPFHTPLSVICDKANTTLVMRCF